MIGCGACFFQFLLSFLLKCIFFFILTCCFNLLFHAITFIPANTLTLNQRWNNIDPQRSSTLLQRWYLIENESWADVHLSTLFQDWQNNIETTLIELLRFNVDEPKLFQRWNLVENESWADVCLSTLSFQVQMIYSFYVKTWSNYSFNCNEMILLDRIYIKHIKFCINYCIRNIINTKFQFQ